MGADLDALLASAPQSKRSLSLERARSRSRGCVPPPRRSKYSDQCGLHSDQMALVQAISKGSSCFDPAQDPDAWSKWKHLAQDVDVQKLKFTHDVVKPYFLH